MGVSGVFVGWRMVREGGRAGLIWIVGSESQDDIAVWTHHEGITLHRHSRECLVGDIIPSIIV